MQARMHMHFETAWANQIQLEVTAELDNPHTITTRTVTSLMLGTLRIMAEEARAENERYIYAEQRGGDGDQRSDAEREEERERGVLERGAHERERVR